MMRFYEQLAAALAEKQPFVLALISGTKGSSPQRIGAKALFFPDGELSAPSAAAASKPKCRLRAPKSHEIRPAATFDMVLDHNFGWDDGLICGGSVSGLILPRAAEVAELWRKLAAVNRAHSLGCEKRFFHRAGGVRCDDEWLYQETVSPPSDLWIAGSGHVAQAVAPLALQLDFAVTVFDDRPELANSQFFPPDVQLQVGAWHELLKLPLPQSPPSASSSRAATSTTRWCCPSGFIIRSFFSA
jgi:xanthine dehydrogenase accessory factor